MDELSLLEADAIPAAAEYFPPAADFTASLDYIDSLASRRVLTLSRRDLSTITTTAIDPPYLMPWGRNKAVPDSHEYDSLSSLFRPSGDARRYHPESDFRPQVSTSSRAASRVIANRVSPSFLEPTPDNPVVPWDPQKEREKDRIAREGMKLGRPYTGRGSSFYQPSALEICLKRKMRKQVMNAYGYAGKTGFNRSRRNYWSRVMC